MLLQQKNQYHIQQVQFRGDSSLVQQRVRETMSQTLLKPNDPFDLEIITTERLRIDNHLKENGFYFFSPEYLCGPRYIRHRRGAGF